MVHLSYKLLSVKGGVNNKNMKKVFIFNLLLLAAKTAHAQEVTTVEVSPFWQDKTFLMLVGGAIFLIIVLIVKKVLEKRALKAYEEEGNESEEITENYESS